MCLSDHPFRPFSVDLEGTVQLNIDNFNDYWPYFHKAFSRKNLIFNFVNSYHFPGALKQKSSERFVDLCLARLLFLYRTSWVSKDAEARL